MSMIVPTTKLLKKAVVYDVVAAFFVHDVLAVVTYTIDELLFRALAYSDNNANMLIFDALDKKIIHKVYRDFNVPMPLKYRAEDFMTVKQYASFFRVLFNASYLSKEMSEKALSYLTRSSFQNGLIAGVPGEVAVAHKFGERESLENPGVKQLHDCGIVYYPGHPYLLCIMSRGKDYEALDDIIRETSKLVYEDVDKHARENQQH